MLIFMSSEILVTGGAGFIGSNIVRQLSQKNTVTVVDDLSEGHAENLEGLKVDLIKEDVRNTEFLERLFQEKKFGKVFHLAASFANQKSIDFPTQDLEINGLATLHLLEQCAKHKVKKFVYASSSCIYGPVKGEMAEELKPMPETPYAITKLLGEHYTQFYHDFHNLDATIVRYFNVYGPCEYPGPYRNVMPKFLSLALQGKALTVTGTGEETRDFTFVEDAAKATILASEKPGAKGQAINIGTGKPTRIIDLANEVNKVAGNKAAVQFAPQRNWDHVKHRLAKVERMKSVLGFVPKTTLQEGVGKTAEWFRKSVIK